MGSVEETNITPLSIVDGDIAVGAGLSASKLKHHTPYLIDWGYSDAGGSIAVADWTICVGMAGTVVGAWVWVSNDGSNTDIDFDVQVDGSSILTGVMNVTHSTGNFTAVTGSVSSGSFTASQRLAGTIETVTQNTGTTGPRMVILVNHNYLG